MKDLQEQNRLRIMFRAFNSRNYRLFFFGQCFSLIGTWIQNIAMSWLIYGMTGSAWLMGLLMFFNALPSLLLSPFAGVIIDRVHKHKMLVIMQILFMIQALILATLTILNVIQLWHILILGIFINILAAFDMPLRQSFVIHLVDNPKDMTNAISLNSSCFNLARLIGPAIAGLLISAWGEGICFLINGLSFIPVIIAICMMKVHETIEIKNHTIIEDLKEGLKYTIECKPIAYTMLFLAIVSFIGMVYPLLMPILSKDILDGDARILGILMSSAGVGALCASLILAAKKTIHFLPQMLCIGAFILGMCFVLQAFLPYKTASIILMFGVGFGMVGSLITSNTLIQSVVDNDKRGRVMSIHAIAFVGTVPFSNIITGWIAQHIGALATFGVFGATIILADAILYKKILSLKFEKQV